MEETPNQQAYREFQGIICIVCKHAKKRFESFCSGCYYKLDTNMRQNLYKRFNFGYEEAYFEAKEFLIKEQKTEGK